MADNQNTPQDEQDVEAQSSKVRFDSTKDVAGLRFDVLSEDEQDVEAQAIKDRLGEPTEDVEE